jgi:hypothetical protein
VLELTPSYDEIAAIELLTNSNLPLELLED